VLLKLSKYLLSQWVSDLRIDARVPYVAVSQVIGYILNTASGFKQVYSNGVTERFDILLHLIDRC